MGDMDADLARALQEEEFAIARRHPGQDERASLFGQLEGCMAKVIKVLTAGTLWLAHHSTMYDHEVAEVTISP